MKQIKIERKVHRPRQDRYEALPLDPRDPDILRAKQLARLAGAASLESAPG